MTAVTDFECQVHACTHDAAHIVVPDDANHAVLLCETCYHNAYNGLCSLSVGGEVLIHEPWCGWSYLPDSSPELQELAREFVLSRERAAAEGE